jgi:uroporphyrinogen decarboxylase
MSSKGDIGHPGRASLPDWAKLQEYLDWNTPDVYEHARYDLSKRLLETIDEDKYKIFMLGLGPVDIAAGIRGFSDFLIDHKRNPEKLNKLLENLTSFFIDSMKASFRYGINPHGFILFDDLGSQHGPFFGRKTFEQFYDRVYSPIISKAHDLGCEVFLHCCGKVDQLIPPFIKWGLDVIEFDSPRMSGYPDLSPYRGKISMWGCINIQSIYLFGTPEECEREVWHMVRNLGTKRGGFGAYYYPQFDVIQVPHENIKAFDRGLEKFGDYSKIPPYWWDIQVPKSWKNDKEQDIIPPLPTPNI